MDALFDFYGKINQLHHQDQMEIARGLSDMVSCIHGYDAQVNGIKKLLLPQLSAISAYASEFEHSVRNGVSVDPAKHILMAQVFDRISYMIPRLSLDLDENQSLHPLVSVFQEAWPMIANLFELYKVRLFISFLIIIGSQPSFRKINQNFKMFDSANSSIYFTNLTISIGSFFGIFSSSASIVFSKISFLNNFSCYLFLTGVCVEIFICYEDLKAMFSHYAIEYSKLVLPVLSTPQSFVQHPDIAEDYFMIIMDFLLQSPVTFIQTGLTESTLQCAILGMLSQHREAYTRIATVLRYFIYNAHPQYDEGFLFDHIEMDVTRGVTKTPAVVSHFRELVLRHGQVLVKYSFS